VRMCKFIERFLFLTTIFIVSMLLMILDEVGFYLVEISSSLFDDL